MALMADINNGVKNSPFVLGSGVGAVNRFARNAKLKQAASPVIPVLPIELPEPVQTISFGSIFDFPQQTPHPFKIKYNCYNHLGTPFVFGAENNNEQLYEYMNDQMLYQLNLMELILIYLMVLLMLNQNQVK